METDSIIMLGAQLKKLIGKKLEPLITEYDLRLVELDILVFLSKEKGRNTAREIIHKKHLSKAHISKSIDNMRVRGFIEISEDKEDHRILHIIPTKKSEEVIKKAEKIYEDCKEIIRIDITDEEMKVVSSVIQKINNNIDNELEKMNSN
ncbi:MAG: MarR family winged helix-turn-helix transcriptional regulator [Lachnospiraceae bacterium]